MSRSSNRITVGVMDSIFNKKSLLLVWLTVLTFTFSALAPITYSLSEEQRRLYNSGVYLYDLEGTGGGLYNCSLVGNTNAEKAWNFLIGQGLTPEQSAGLLGNLEAEAPGVTPTLQERVSGYTQEESWQNERGGWGIVQWTGMRSDGPAGVRRLNVKNAVIEELGAQYYTMNELPDEQQEELLLFQLNYMVEESTNRSVRPQSHPVIQQPFDAENEWEGLKQMTSVSDAAYYWEWNFERAGVPRIQARLAYAQNFFNEFASGSPAATASCANISLGDIECPANIEPHPTEPGYFRMPSAPNNEYNVYSRASNRWGGQELICAIHSVSIAYKEIYGSQSTVQIGNLNTPLEQPSRSHQYGVAVDLLANGEICAGAWVGSGCTQSSYSNEATSTLGRLFVDTGMIKNIWWCPPDATGHRANNGLTQNEIRNHADSVGQPLNINCQWQNRSSNGHADHFHIDLLDEFRVHNDQRYSSPSSGLFVN